MKEQNKTTFTNFLDLCRKSNVEIVSIAFEGGCKGKVTAQVAIKGSFLKISDNLKGFVKALSPFIRDKYFGKWLNITGSMDLHEFNGTLVVEVGFRGIGLMFE